MFGFLQSLGHFPTTGFAEINWVHYTNVLLNPDFLDSLLLTFYLCHIPLTIETTLMLFVFATTINLIGAWRWQTKHYYPSDKTYSEKSNNSLLLESWPVLISNFSMFLVRQLDLWAVGIWCSLFDVALYGAAIRLTIVIGFFLEIIHAVAPPFISSLYSHKKIFELELVVRGMTTLASLPAITTFLIILYKGESILNFIYGQEYQNGLTILLILGFGKLFHILSGPCGLILLMTGHQRLLMTINLCCGVLIFITALLMAQKWGAAGVAIATTGVLILQNILTIAIVRKKVGFWSTVGPSVFFNFRFFVNLITKRI